MIATFGGCYINIEGNINEYENIYAGARRLSLHRAMAVRNFLISEYDVASDRLIPIGNASEKPVISDTTDAARFLNRRTDILKNGIRPSKRKFHPDYGYTTNPKGVYVYPYSRNKSQIGIRRRQLKVWDKQIANYNGFIFRLIPEDCPMTVGYWFSNRYRPHESIVPSLQKLADLYKNFFTGEIVNSEYNWTDFEIILPKRIMPQRIIRILKDREKTS
ncbi:OmpA family protein [candidate division KSB1 bacterium]|nr:OmpA family protein [candidate division KSB1 bacterium]